MRQASSKALLITTTSSPYLASVGSLNLRREEPRIRAPIGTDSVGELADEPIGEDRRQLHVIDYLKAENRVLREQLSGRRLRFTDDQRRRLAVRGEVLGRRALGDVTSLLTPDTILRWYRQLIAAKYDGSAKRGPGRPATAASIQALRGWSQHIKRILKDHGLSPAPERRKRMPWKTFIKAHLGAIAAMDFFSVEVLSPTGLIRYCVLFVIDII